MDSQELSLWLAYDKLDCIPDPWVIGSQIACVVANAFRTRKKAFGLDDFYPREKPVKIMSGESGMAMMKTITAVEEAKRSPR